MLCQTKILLTILNITPIVYTAVRRSNSQEEPTFDGSYDGAHFPPSSPFGAAFKEYSDLPKFPGGTDNMTDFPGTYLGQLAGPFPVPFESPLPKPFPGALTSPRIYPSQFFNSFNAFQPNYPFGFSGSFPYIGGGLPFVGGGGYPFVGGGGFPFIGGGGFPFVGGGGFPYAGGGGAFPFAGGAFPFSGALPYGGGGAYQFGGGIGSLPYSGGFPFFGGRPPYRFPNPPLLQPPPRPANPTSSSVVLPESTAATLAAAKLIYGIVTRYADQVLPYPITNPIPLAVPEGVRVPVAVDRPVPVKSKKPLQYAVISDTNDDEHISPPASTKPNHYLDILHPRDSLPSVTDIKPMDFEPNTKLLNIKETKPLNFVEIISQDDDHEILHDLDTDQELIIHKNHLSDVN